MKKFAGITVITLLVMNHCFCQDTIIRRIGEDVVAKIIEINETEIKYKRFENPDGPIYVVSKSDVVRILYQNGTTDVFNTNFPKNPESDFSGVTNNDSYIRGQADAVYNYTGYKAAGTGTLIASLASPLIGLIPAIACSSTAPREETIHYPDQSLIDQPAYLDGYIIEAKKIKRGKVWTNWTIGFGVNVALVLILAASR